MGIDHQLWERVAVAAAATATRAAANGGGGVRVPSADRDSRGRGGVAATRRRCTRRGATVPAAGRDADADRLMPPPDGRLAPARPFRVSLTRRVSSVSATAPGVA